MLEGVTDVWGCYRCLRVLKMLKVVTDVERRYRFLMTSQNLEDDTDA